MSILDVASSKINILGSAKITLAIVSSCFWPAETPLVSSFNIELYPLGKVFIK